MNFINNKKRSDPRHDRRLLANSLLVSTTISSKQLYSSNSHTPDFDPKHWFRTGTQGKNKGSNSNNKIISVIKADEMKNLSFPISPTEWSTISEHVLNSESGDRFDACCLIVEGLLIL